MTSSQRHIRGTDALRELAQKGRKEGEGEGTQSASQLPGMRMRRHETALDTIHQDTLDNIDENTLLGDICKCTHGTAKVENE